MKSFATVLSVSSLLFSTSRADTYPNSCNPDLDGGVAQLKFLDGEEYPVVNAKCDNGYAILDYNLDPNVASYFSSWKQWYKARYGPTNSDTVNWQDWFIPSNSEHDHDMEFLVSPDCSECSVEAEQNYYHKKSTYYMSGNIWGCFWIHKGFIGLDESWAEDTCYANDEGANVPINIQREDDRITISDYSADAALLSRDTGACSHSVRSAASDVVTTHENCAYSGDYVGKPSIGTNGKYCVCVKPSEEKFFDADDVETSETVSAVIESETQTSDKNVFENEENEVSENVSVEEQVVELWQKDFLDGTYRILSSGTYRLMEDIEFDFKANKEYPNAAGAYWPEEEDNVNGYYPGAGDSGNTYSQGFFAGISVESDDVTIDLNGYEMKMSDLFYYQQRWFTCIELSGQYFLPAQGTFFSGPMPTFSSNVVIKDGSIGLSSHHGIHGNDNKNVLIDNVKIYDFETHGIQLNGFEGLKITNSEVGPASDRAYLNGQYAHARTLINRYRQIAEDDVDNTEFQFYGREEKVTMADIVEEMETQMNLALNYVVYGLTPPKHSDDYNSFIAAKKTFTTKNLHGDSSGATIYGMFLNTHGASLFTYNLYTDYFSKDAHIENVKIHGITHRMAESTLIRNGQLLLNPLLMSINFENVFEFDEIADLKNEDGFVLKYRSDNILTDATIISQELTDDFQLLGQQWIGFLSDFAFGRNGAAMQEHASSLKLFYNSDIMFHIGKGIQALRIDGVDGVYIKNVEIYDNTDITPVTDKDDLASLVFPTELTFKYNDLEHPDPENMASFTLTTQVTVHNFGNTPMIDRFAGNSNVGINLNAARNVIIEDVNIHDLESKTGAVFGISIWPAVEVNFKGDIVVSNLGAGSKIDGTYNYFSEPNRAAEVCAIRNYETWQDYVSTINIDEANLVSSCLQGHIGCLGESNRHTFLTSDEVGSCTTDDNDETMLSKYLTLSGKNGMHNGLIMLVAFAVIAQVLVVGYIHFGRQSAANNEAKYTPLA